MSISDKTHFNYLLIIIWYAKLLIFKGILLQYQK